MTSRLSVEFYRGMRNISTPHPPEEYPGVLVVRPGPQWRECAIVANPGETFEALGGEHAPGFTSPSGARAEPFTLRPRDRVTMVRDDLSFHLAEWKVERAPAE